MLSLLAAGMVRAATPSRSAARMCSKAGPVKFDMDFSANWFAAALATVARPNPIASTPNPCVARRVPPTCSVGECQATLSPCSHSFHWELLHTLTLPVVVKP